MTSTLAPVWTWLRLDLRGRIRALVLLGLLVAVGSGTVLAAAAAAAARRGDSAMDRLRAITLPAHAMAQPNQEGFDWDAVRRLPGVAAVGSFLLSDVTLEGLPGAFVSYPSTDKEFTTAMERPVVLAGRWVTGPGYQRLFPDNFFKFHQVLLALRAGADPAAVTQRLATQFEPPLTPIQHTQISNILILPLAFGAFLALLALGVNGHTLATGIHRRRHAIATMRALGLTPRQCRQAIFTQATTVATIGLLFGIPLGLALGRILWRVVTDITPLWYAPPFALPTTLLLIPTALTLATLLAIHPIRRVTRYSVSTCLRAA